MGLILILLSQDKENLILTFLGMVSKLPSQHQVILLRISAKVCSLLFCVSLFFFGEGITFVAIRKWNLYRKGTYI